jgi:hypothetical protein
MFSILGPEETVLLKTLDGIFESWGIAQGAKSMTMPPLLPVKDLAKFDYFANFPHQAILAATLDLEAVKNITVAPALMEIPTKHLEPPALGLPSAACYAVYLHFRDQELPAEGTLITVLGRCFRKETNYQPLRRLLGFHMREIVALGSQQYAAQHLDTYSSKILNFAQAVDIPLRKEAATDPFYDRGGPRAVMQTLFPVKHEFCSEGLAIASVNTHRNFFGERCGIKTQGSAAPIFTSCVAFGLERWLSALYRRYENWGKATNAVEAAGS